MPIKVNKTVRVDSVFKMVKLQYLLYCYLNGKSLSNSQLDILTTVTLHGYNKDSITKMLNSGFSKSRQSIRNTVCMLGKEGYIIEDGDDRKVNPELKIGVSDTILFELKAINES